MDFGKLIRKFSILPNICDIYLVLFPTSCISFWQFFLLSNCMPLIGYLNIHFCNSAASRFKSIMAFCYCFIFFFLRLALVILYCATEQNRLDQVYFYDDFDNFIFTPLSMLTFVDHLLF